MITAGKVPASANSDGSDCEREGARILREKKIVVSPAGAATRKKEKK